MRTLVNNCTRTKLELDLASGALAIVEAVPPRVRVCEFLQKEQLQFSAQEPQKEQLQLSAQEPQKEQLRFSAQEPDSLPGIQR